MRAGKIVICIGLLWLSGVALRITVLAVPPVLPLIQTDLRLRATEIGLLSSLPVVMFSLAALPASLLITRLGARTALIAALLVVAIGSALRGASWNAATLYSATMIMGAGVAIMQPTMPMIVRQWLPKRVGFGTAVYSNGLMIGEILPVSIALPILMPLLGGQWRLELTVWSLPVIGIALLAMIMAPHTSAAGVNGVNGVRTGAGWPNWRDGLIWRLGVMFGSISSVYFASNAFLPGYLASVGRRDLIDAALVALNLGQLPASLAMLPIAGKLERRAWPLITAGMVMLISVIGLVFMVGPWTPVWAGLLGCAEGAALILGLALPALLSGELDVGRISAAMFALGYAIAVAVALTCGAAWDMTGTPGWAFAPISLALISLCASALILKANKLLR